jgi:pyruvate, orthophosphate dikinase
MLGHRGVRLGVTYPEITEMQVRAILEAAGELIKAGKKAHPEIMIPVTCNVTKIQDKKGACLLGRPLAYVTGYIEGGLCCP